MKVRHTKKTEKREPENAGNKEEIPIKQPKVRVQIMIPYHVLLEIEKQRQQGESLNRELTNLIIIGLKAKVVK